MTTETTAKSETASLFTVTQLTQAIKRSLESTFPFVRLQGEVSNFRRQASGHLYFSLKDANAQISAVMFRGDASRLKALPKDGDQVLVTGALNVYPPRGNYQIVVRELTLTGIGELLAKLHELKVKLHKKGYFSDQHKQALPPFPRRVGLITSPTGAAVQDILNVLGRRAPGLDVIVNPVKVQGSGAAEEVAAAIDQCNAYALADVLIVGRGGGSIEDLWAFNEEIVAEAIFRSKVPIVAAVGHETDHCIAEYVADLRAPTPSAAAEIVTAAHVQQREWVAQQDRHLRQTLRHLLIQSRYRLNGVIRHPLFREPYALLGPWLQKLDDLRGDGDAALLSLLQRCRLELQGRQRQCSALNPISRIAHSRQKLFHWSRTLDSLWQQRERLHRERLQHVTSALKAVDPKNLLRRGYSILFSEKDRSIISTVNQLAPQQKLRALVADGEVEATVDAIHPERSRG